ncbi:GIY-YIG nuclease family protein [Hymenobacter sp. M29]|uniref:GIY-YIG nuclease family protein n=1 Tax=Hymenobacter mellowenesis TaxID=3063995 RepID=A0ABT9AJ82_9BACT|nr:GIY-YIG nuclease family protein [Hymenobacter sp. M29]MDO7849021.1 GIY-YIG nuclease family protein [Hymenobacter sp. M29]
MNRAPWIAQQHGRKAVLYVVRVYGNGEAFCKIGITFDLTRRFSRLRFAGYKWRTLARFSSYNAGKVFDLEQALHQRFAALSYVPLLPFSGETECYGDAAPILAALPAKTFFLKPTIDI